VAVVGDHDGHHVGDADRDGQPGGAGMPDHVGDQFPHHRDDVVHEVGRQVLHLVADAQVRAQVVGLGHGAHRLADAAPRRDGVGVPGVLELEDRRPDPGDGAVEFVDPLADAGRHLGAGLLQRAADPVQRQAGREDPLDDVVVQVAGDAVPVGLDLQAALAFPRPGQLEDHRGLGGEGRQQVEFIGGERFAPREAHDGEQPSPGHIPQRGGHGRTEVGRHLDGRR
jgi:hypothetical protein